MKSRFVRKDAGCVASRLARAAGFAAVLVATLPQHSALSQVPEIRLGTSFDCSRAGPNVPSLVCQTPELQLADVSQMQVYYTLRHAQPDRQQELRNQFTTSIQALVRDCSTDQVREGGTQPACVARKLGELRTFWLQQLERLGNAAALEEARLPPGHFIGSQQALKARNFLPAEAVLDGVFGSGSRQALARFQAERGMPATGFLTAATAEALRGPANAPLSTTATTTQQPASGAPLFAQAGQSTAPRRPGERAIQTLLVEGVGSTIESAVQNAAENALRQVVGSFISTDTQIQRRTQIAEGIREQSRTINRQTREYSQGSIQTFEVIESRQDGGIFRVSARAVVRIDDFQVYMQRAIEGSTEINQGLFAQEAVRQRNERSRSDLLLERVALPLSRGEGLSFSVQPPQPLTQENFPCAPRGQATDIHYGNVNALRNLPCPMRDSAMDPFSKFRFLREQIDREGRINNVFIFPVRVTMDSAVAERIFRDAREFADNRVERVNVQPVGRLVLQSTSAALDLERNSLFFQNPRRAEARIIRQVGNSTAREFAGVEFELSEPWQNFLRSLSNARLSLQLLDRAGTILEDYTFGVVTQGRPGPCIRGQCDTRFTGIWYDFRPSVYGSWAQSGNNIDLRGSNGSMPLILSLDRNYTFYIIVRLRTH